MCSQRLGLKGLLPVGGLLVNPQSRLPRESALIPPMSKECR